MSKEAIAAKLRDGAVANDFDKVVKFDMGDDGVLVVNHTNIVEEDIPADCTVTVSQSDLESMIAGELDPTSAFMQGKIKIDGDMSLAMQLSQLL